MYITDQFVWEQLDLSKTVSERLFVKQDINSVCWKMNYFIEKYEEKIDLENSLRIEESDHDYRKIYQKTRKEPDKTNAGTYFLRDFTG